MNHPSLAISSLIVLLIQFSQSAPCPQVIIQSSASTHGNITSPNYPNPYPSDTHCTFILKGLDSQGIEIKFQDLDLEPPYKAGCLSDYIDLDIYDMRDRMTLHKRFCGNSLPESLTVLHPKAKLVFRSNHAVHHRGFLVSYTFVQEDLVRPPNNTQDCGEEFLTPGGGVLIFPGKKVKRDAISHTGLECTWLWRVDYNRHVYLRIQELEFQGSTENCQKAQLAIYDGYENTNDETTVLRKFCGDKSHYKAEDERALLSSRNRVIIRFTISSGNDKGRQTNNSLPNQEVRFRIIWSEVSADAADVCAGKGRFLCSEPRACVSKDHLGTFSTCPQMNYCIPSDLVCDGISHCAESDASDERRCLARSLNTVVFVTTVSAFLIAAIVLLVAVIVKKVRKKGSGDSESKTMRLCWKKTKNKASANGMNNNRSIYPTQLHVDALNRATNVDNSSVDSVSICPLSDSESSEVSMCPFHGPKYFNHLPVLREDYNLDSDDSSFMHTPLPISEIDNKFLSVGLRKTGGWVHNKRPPMQRTDAVCLSDEDCSKSMSEESNSPCLCHNSHFSPALLPTLITDKIEDSGIELVDSFDLHTATTAAGGSISEDAQNENSSHVFAGAFSGTVNRCIQTEAGEGGCDLEEESQEVAEESPSTCHLQPDSNGNKFFGLCSTVTTFGVYGESTSTEV